MWAEGKITVESLEDERKSKKGNGPVLGVIKEVNKHSGKVSTVATAFSEPNWGDECRKYLASINDNLCPTTFKKIFDLAHEHIKPPCRGTSQTTATGRLEEGLDLADRHMLVIDISDDET